MDTLASLHGKRILLTRAQAQAKETARVIREAGGTPIEVPLLHLVAATPLPYEIDTYDWLVFTSKNAVQFFFEGHAGALPATVKIATVGEKTKQAVEERGYTVQFVPTSFVAEVFAEEFIPLVSGTRVLFPRGDLARDVLVKALQAAEIEVTDRIVYRTTSDETMREELLKTLQDGVDVILFASPSAVTSFMILVEGTKWREWTKGCTIGCIGPITEREAAKYFSKRIVPQTYTMQALLQCLASHIKNEGEIEMNHLQFQRHRRLRQTASMRALVRETHLHAEDFIYPIFVVEGENKRNAVQSMPGVDQISLDLLQAEMQELVDLGIQSVIVFGVPAEKDEVGSGAYCEHGIVQRAIAQIKEEFSQLVVIADTCLCQYTSHGHCGVIEDGIIVNDESLALLAKTAVSQAKAGADIIAPSNMMDGFVTAIRHALDENGFSHVPIMSYAVKYSSAHYGPFRDAAHSSPKFGDRKAYQMDPANRLEALREAESDVQEGADFLIVKPALSYLDIIRDVKNNFNLPIVAYNVSGEYSMVKAAAQNGWINEKEIVLEQLLSMKRAGADLILTYFAKDAARWLKEGTEA